MLLDHRTVVVRRERSRVCDAVRLLVVQESEAVERAHRDVVVRGVYSGSILPERAFDDADALAKDPAGFGAHVLEDARTQEEDEAGASAFADGTAK